ncbi:ribonuclease H-like domain-containing protein [Obelidium mucronatum]|nr:ribonuclease H-like domain-containing protein [Obelidium mucronatum]
MHQFRIISLDSVQVAPNAQTDVTHSAFAFPPIRLYRVPVIRVFAATPAGQKACIHIHQVFPYFYIGYEGSLDTQAVYRFIYQLGRSINHALALSLKVDPDNLQRTQYIPAILLVKGIPFYGFHSKYSYFLKIHLVDPGLQTRVVELLSKGVVMGKRFQTYESHIPYLPQFMIDHNLLGMDYLDVSDLKFRRPLKVMPRQVHPTNTQLYYTPQTIPESMIWPLAASLFVRESFCELEIDILAGDILNRTRIVERPRKALIDLRNGTEKLDTKLVPSLKSLWEDEIKRRERKNIAPIPSPPPPDPSLPEPQTQSVASEFTVGNT